MADNTQNNTSNSNNNSQENSNSSGWVTVNTSTSTNVQNLEIQKGNTDYWIRKTKEKK